MLRLKSAFFFSLIFVSVFYFLPSCVLLENFLESHFDLCICFYVYFSVDFFSDCSRYFIYFIYIYINAVYWCCHFTSSNEVGSFPPFYAFTLPIYDIIALNISFTCIQNHMRQCYIYFLTSLLEYNCFTMVC